MENREGQTVCRKKFEDADKEDDLSGWIPPSVYKKPPEKIYTPIWEQAMQALVNCDVLRVIGSSLRNEDFPLISLIFDSQIICKEQRGIMFPIEMIVPDKDTSGDEGMQGVMQRLPFLSAVQNLDVLTVFKENKYVGDNVLLGWFLRKFSEVEIKSGRTPEFRYIKEIVQEG